MASRQTRIGLVPADAEFDNERNQTYIRQRLGVQSVVPAKRGKKTWHVRGLRAEMRRAFPRRIYGRRALIESVFSAVKRKLSARTPVGRFGCKCAKPCCSDRASTLYRLKHR
jgi:hypothetical protein